MPTRPAHPGPGPAAPHGVAALSRAADAPWFDAHLARLAALPAHGNRRLTCDKLLMALLLAFFEPMARSLRLIEDHGDFGGRLDLGPDLRRLAKSTTADALAALDARPLLPLIDDLRARCPGLCHDDPALHVLTQRIVAADGTYFDTFCDVAWALKHTKTDGRKQGQVRANVQMDTATWCPQVVTVSGDDGEGEAAAFAKDLLPGVLYVADRNFVAFGFLRAVLEAGGEFVVRAEAASPTMEVVAALPLRAADAAAGVVADEVVRLAGQQARREGMDGRTFRRVRVEAADRAGRPETFELLTSLTDGAGVPAATVAAAYRQRWQIELAAAPRRRFFKWLKTHARLDSLLSTSRNGITFQLYAAVIAVLMMYARAGRRVSVYALAALSAVARGEQTLGRAMETIGRRERERELARARQARRRAAKKPA